MPEAPEITAARQPDIISLEKEVRSYPWVQRLLARCRNSRIVEVADIRTIITTSSVLPYPADFQGRQHLLIGKQRGPFIKPCPCSPQTRRCGYYFINIGLGCPIDCSYCFLQGFLQTSFPVLYVNFDDLLAELQNLDSTLQRQGQKIRMGTGEMTDSLVFEPLTHYGQYLANCFRRFPHLILELKTKSLFSDELLARPIANVVLAWSLTPDPIAQREEPLAPTTDERISAAARAVAAGHRVGFHFDPIIAGSDWQQDYWQTVDKLFQKVAESAIAWISLGTFRIFPSLRDVIRTRHPQSRTLHQELVVGYDGKLRYFKKQRVEIYRQMAAWITAAGGESVPVYLCMESHEVWHRVFPDSKLISLNY